MSPAVNAVLIVNGGYALQLRDENAKTGAGRWGCFGGTIEDGETPEQALRREIFEELELLLGRLEPLCELGHVKFYWVDVSEQWRSHHLHEGERAEVFEHYDIPRNTTRLTREAITVHRLKADVPHW